jgi:hypothetical protein
MIRGREPCVSTGPPVPSRLARVAARQLTPVDETRSGVEYCIYSVFVGHTQEGNMGLEIFGHGVTGEILVEDQRSDGSVILLQCTPYGTTSSPGQSGVTVASSESGSWPMLQEAGVARRRRGKLHLDTTQMPGGVLAFNKHPR